MEEEKSVNFQYKARLFEMIFSRKKELLELYNAVNESYYTDPEQLEINTLQNAVYMAMHNDISFLFDTANLYLYEHQSTWNPNIPLRSLEYIASLYSAITKDENLFSSRRIQIPTPRFVVFYNGTDKDVPDRTVLKLSDMFLKPEPEPALELATVVLNINMGHNRKLMETSRTLRGYAEYTARVRKYAGIMSTAAAVDRAVRECIKEGILADFLSRYRAEAIRVSIFEYDEEKHMRQEREEHYAIGYEKGRQAGLEQGVRNGIVQGRETSLLESIQSLISNMGLTVDQAMDALNVPDTERPGYIDRLK